MVEMPSSHPGGILREYIERADIILRNKKLQSVASDRLTQTDFDLGKEVGALLDDIFKISSRIKEGNADSMDVFDICGVLKELTGEEIRDGELFALYIIRLKNIPLVKEARKQITATISSATPPAPARPILQPTLRGASRSPVPPAATKAVPPPIPTNYRPTNVSSPVPATAPVAGRPTLPGRVEVMLRGGGKTFVTRRGTGGAVNSPSIDKPTAVSSAQTASPVPTTSSRSVITTQPSGFRSSASAQPTTSQQPKTGMPIRIGMPKLQPEDNASGGVISRGKSREGNTKIRHIDDIKRARRPGGAQ